MSRTLRCVVAWLLVALIATPASLLASAYNAKPKLIVIIVIDQFRGDYLDAIVTVSPPMDSAC